MAHTYSTHTHYEIDAISTKRLDSELSGDHEVPHTHTHTLSLSLLRTRALTKAHTMHSQIDAIGTKRFDSELSGDREVQRTMLELLNQLDGFSSADDVKVCVCVCAQSV